MNCAFCGALSEQTAFIQFTSVFSSSGRESKQPYLFRLPPFCRAFVALPKFSTSLSLPLKTRDHFALFTGLKAAHSVGSGG